jgi:hypothetical protein
VDPRIGFWDSFPLGIPDSRGSGFIPWDPRLPLDHRLPWIPDYRLGFPGIPWDSGFENSKSSQVVATMYRRIVIYHQYQDFDNQNSKHKIKACRTISFSNSILKIDSILFMALMY